MKVLITGASTGIGKEMALYLGKLGYDLYVVARNRDKLNLLKKHENLYKLLSLPRGEEIVDYWDKKIS